MSCLCSDTNPLHFITNHFLNSFTHLNPDRKFLLFPFMALRKAVGAVKDQTSIGIVKLTSQLTPSLKIAVVKATSHDDDPAGEKYIRQILHLTAHSTLHVRACVRTLSKRLAKTRDWIVALKVLILINRLLNEGDPEFLEEVVYATRRGTRLLNLSDFRSSSWDHSAFVRTLAFYLDQKVEFIRHSWSQEEEKQPVGRPRRSVSDNYGGYGERLPERSHSYGDLDIERKPPARSRVPLAEMGIEGVLGRMNQLHRLLDRFLASRPTGTAKNCRMVMFALYPIVQESFKVYGDICEVLSVLLDRFFDIEHADCLKVFEAYCNSAKQIDELVGFYNWCKACGVVRSTEFPEVQRVTEKVLETLEEFIRDKEKKPESVKKQETPVPAAVENTTETNEIKSPPTLENYPEPEVTPEPVAPLKDLVDLTEESVSTENQSDKLALALFSAPQTGSWGTLNGVTSAWQNPAAEIGKADWELALVESVSHLSSQTGSLPGGFDPLMLNGMYDAGLVKQYTSTAEFNSGSASSVAITGLGKSGTTVLALPAPDGSVVSVGQDPFAASMSVPPPAYVQMADMEKKQQLLVQEQQVWNQYAREGMQGQVGLGRINGSGFYNTGSSMGMGMGMVPYGTQQQPVNGVGSGGVYYYQPY